MPRMRYGLSGLEFRVAPRAHAILSTIALLGLFSSCTSSDGAHAQAGPTFNVLGSALPTENQQSSAAPQVIEHPFEAVRHGNEITVRATRLVHHLTLLVTAEVLIWRNGKWEPVERPPFPADAGGFFLGEQFLPPVPKRVCGGLSTCKPLSEQILKATQLVVIGSRDAPSEWQEEVSANQFVVDHQGIRRLRIGSPALPVPIVERRVLDDELAVKVSYFTNERCSGKPIVATVAVFTAPGP